MIPLWLWISVRATIGIMHVQVVEEGKNRPARVALNPLQDFLVDCLRALAFRIGPPVVTLAFSIFIQPSVESNKTKRTSDFAFLAAVQIKPRKLPSVECADKAVGDRIEVILKMHEATAQADIAGEKDSISRERSGAIATAMHGFSECGEAVQIFLPPAQPRLHILQAVLERIASGQEGSVRRKCP